MPRRNRSTPSKKKRREHAIARDAAASRLKAAGKGTPRKRVVKARERDADGRNEGGLPDAEG